MLHEGPFDVQVADVVAPLVVVQQAVESDRGAREDHLPHLDVGLDGARGAQPDQREPSLLSLLLPGFEVDIGQCVELRDGDIDVSDADARGEYGHAAPLVGARHGFEFPIGDFAFDLFEKGGYQCDAAGIADENHDVGKLLRLEVEVENRSVAVDNQFGRRDGSHKKSVFNFFNWHKSNIFTSNIKEKTKISFI